MSSENTMYLLIDGSAGIYLPRTFYESSDFRSWNISISDYRELSEPGNEHYWDTWNDLLDRAECHDNDGHIWRLHHDGDLWAVRDDHNFES